MTSGPGQSPDAFPTTPAARRSAIALLGLAGLSQLVFGIAAIAEMPWLRDNVEDIESNPNYGRLYFGLATWGVLLALIGLFQLGAARALGRRREHGRTVGLLTTLLGLAVAFFTLAIFHAATFVSLLLLFSALYVLSYRVS